MTCDERSPPCCDGSEIEATSILNGAFVDLITAGSPALDVEAGKVVIWGDGEQKMEFTSVVDTARFTAAASMALQTPRFLRLAGNSLTMHELADRCSAWLGQAFEREYAGSVEDLGAEIRRQMKINPGDPDHSFPAWQGLQYLHNMVSGTAHLTSLENDLFPHIQAEDVATFLAHADVPQTA